MHTQSIVPIILCGGVGSRLWPVSRKSFPKQFGCLTNQCTSMIQDTIQRLDAIDLPFERLVIVTNKEHQSIVSRQLKEIGCEADIILEPTGRNTAPAIALAMHHVDSLYQDAHMLVLPSDHVIKDDAAFAHAVDTAYQASIKGHFATFAIHPSHPETGYGYIKFGNDLAYLSGAKCIDSFVEKPDFQRAQSYVASGQYGWNSGMFMFPVETLLKEMEHNEPQMVQQVKQAYLQATTEGSCISPSKSYFEKALNISIDYALMERTDNAVVVPVECGWSDAGSWDSLWNLSHKNSDGNVIRGKVIGVDMQDCYVRNDSKLTVATLGLEGLTVVATDDVIMIADKNRSQDVKTLMDLAGKADKNLIESHKSAQHDWGYEQIVHESASHRSSLYTLDAFSIMNDQYSSLYNTHIIVISGTLAVKMNGVITILKAGEHLNIKAGQYYLVKNNSQMEAQFSALQHAVPQPAVATIVPKNTHNNIDLTHISVVPSHTSHVAA